MSIINAHTPLTIAEVNKANLFDDAIAVLGEMVESNEFMDEMMWFEATHGDHTEYLKAKRLGKGAFTPVNGPIPSISSGNDVHMEPVMLYQADSEVGEDVLNSADDPYLVRDSQDAENLEGIFQDYSDLLLNANEAANPNAIRSLSRRRPSIGPYCLDGGGSGADLSSIWLLHISKRGVHMIYNKNGVAGLKNEDRGRIKTTAPKGTGDYWCWVRHYEIWGGLVVRNEKALIRYANIETDGETAIFDHKKFVQAKGILSNLNGAVAFANRTVKAQIENDAYNGVSWAKFENIQNYGPVVFVAGIGLRNWDSISDSETEVA